MIREETTTSNENRNQDAGSQNEGYLVDRLLFDNMIRIRRSLIPVQVGYAIFFATALVLLLSLFRPATLSGAYVFALMTIAVAVGLFIYQAIMTASRNRPL